MLESNPNTSESASMLREYASAVAAKDANRLMHLYSDDVRVFDLWDSWVYEGKDAWRQAVLCWFASLSNEVLCVTFDQVNLIEFPGYASISAFVTYSAVSESGEALRSMRNRLTWIIETRSAGWIVIHEHTSAPIDHATLRAALGP